MNVVLPKDNNCKYISQNTIGNGGLFVISENNQTFCFNQSITFNSANPAITINNGRDCITIDLNGHCLDGSGPGGSGMGIELFGNGSNTIIIRNGTFKNMDTAILNTNGSLNTLCIENITFDNVENPVILTPMQATLTNVIVKECKVIHTQSQPGSSSLSFGSVHHLEIESSIFNSTIINIVDCTSVIIRDIVIDNSDGLGAILINDSFKIHIENIKIKNAQNAGAVIANTTHVKMVNCKIANTAGGQGLSMSECTNVVLNGVCTQKTGMQGIYMDNCGVTILNGCIVQFSGNHGIHINNSGNNCIKNCQSMQNQGNGYLVNGTSTVGMFDKCIALSNTLAGFLLDMNTSLWKLIGCCSKFNTTDGFANLGTNNTFVNLASIQNQGSAYVGITDQPIITANITDITDVNTNYWTNILF